MKKAILLMLSMFIAAALTACGGQVETPEGSTPLTQPQNSVTDESVETTAPTDTPETEAPTEADSGFDTGWTDNEFEALLPELPFTGWSTKQEDASTYEMELGGLNTSPATNPDDSGEPDGADKDKLIAYLNALTDHGFTVEETAEGYQWLATDTMGNTFEFMCAEGYCWITICKNNTVG